MSSDELYNKLTTSGADSRMEPIQPVRLEIAAIAAPDVWCGVIIVE